MTRASTDENCWLFSLSQDEPNTVASALSDLTKEGCLTQKTKTFLTQYLVYVDKLSKKVDPTNEESNEVACLRHTIPSLSKAFIFLEKEDILTDEAWQLLKDNPFYASQISQGLCVLKKKWAQ
ncbi:hypothetical protein [Legionella brunensis]|uniref:Uncharacterized protein n=1 Tax=Legionella brunensis TaxID=29422 RepID=A0A0W0SNS1_9GAMM|nr:hypothetical protein [Legionella brunensis]KTC84948.1 hypothetical protein Lbru_1163 [Legionella brunensis]